MRNKNSLDRIATLLNCNGCSCCSAGTVYVLPWEVEELRAKGIEVIDFMGGYFIPTVRENGCIYNSATNKKCEIYADRPICCRLFPFDIFYYPEHGLCWVVYNKCQPIWQFVSEPGTWRGIRMLLREFQYSLEGEELAWFYDKEVASLRLEHGQKVGDDYTIVCQVQRGSCRTLVTA